MWVLQEEEEAAQCTFTPTRGPDPPPSAKKRQSGAGDGSGDKVSSFSSALPLASPPAFISLTYTRMI
jgi:hypothetical protein